MIAALLLLLLAQPTPAPSPEPPTELSRMDARCRAKWADNYTMVLWCRDQHVEALEALATWAEALRRERPLDAKRARVVGPCVDKWTDKYGANWTMVWWCVGEQDKALLVLEGEK